MRDQTSTLRNLIQRRAADEPTSASVRARIVAFTSGKGGVGKSNLALNVAVAAAQSGARVCVLDANPGLSNIDVLSGLNSYWNIGHVLTGAKSLGNVIVKGSGGINVICGASGLTDATPTHMLIEQFAELEAAYDLLIVDTGTGLTETARRFAAIADVTFLVTTPEPTAIADAYATLKAWQGAISVMPEVIVNRASSVAQAKQILDRFAQTAATFLRVEIPVGSVVSEDVSVAKAVLARQPFVCLNADSAATRDVRTIAKRLLAGAKPVRKASLLERLSTSDFVG